MDELGGRPHWGKRHFQTADTLRARYPDWDRFQAVRARLDPRGRFANAWTDRVLGQPPGGPPVAERAYMRLERATAALQAPFALIDLDALRANAEDLERRAAGKPIRLASKSLRCRALQEQVLARAGFQGMLAFTLAEALWLASHGIDDMLVAYPTADAPALRVLAEGSPPTAKRITVMLDSTEQLEPLQRAIGDLGRGRGARLHRRRCRLADARRARARWCQALAGAHARAGRRAGPGDPRVRAPAAGGAMMATRRRSPASATGHPGARCARARSACCRRFPRASSSSGAPPSSAVAQFCKRAGRRWSWSTAAAPAACSAQPRGRRDGGGRRVGASTRRRCSTPTAPSARARPRCSRCRSSGVPARSRHGARRRLPRVRARPTRRACPSPTSRRPAPRRPGGRRRGADAAARRGGRRAARSATAYTCATPRRASCASASTACICSRARRSSTRCRPTVARAGAFCERARAGSR